MAMHRRIKLSEVLNMNYKPRRVMHKQNEKPAAADNDMASNNIALQNDPANPNGNVDADFRSLQRSAEPNVAERIITASQGNEVITSTDPVDPNCNSDRNEHSQSKSQVLQRMRKIPAFQLNDSSEGIPNALQASSEEGASTSICTSLTTLTAGPTSSQSLLLPPPPSLQLGERPSDHNGGSVCQTLATTASTPTLHHLPSSLTFTVHLGSIGNESYCSALSDSYTSPKKSRLERRAECKEGKLNLTMFDMIYTNPRTNPMRHRAAPVPIKGPKTQDSALKRTAPVPRKGPKPQDSALKLQIKETKAVETTEMESVDDSVAMPVPQVILNEDGEIVVDEESLEIETTGELEARKVRESTPLIENDDDDDVETYSFYTKRKRTKRWLQQETVKFYRCLQTTGTDFSLMAKLFPDRTRLDLKIKFKKEQKQNLARINKALLNPNTLNFDELKERLETEEHGREELEQQWKEIEEREPKPNKKRRVNTSKAARVPKYGNEVCENENVLQRKLTQRYKGWKNIAASSKKTKLSLNDAPIEKCPEAAKRSLLSTLSTSCSIKEASNSHYEKATVISVDYLKLAQNHVDQKQVTPQNMEEDLNRNLLMDFSAADTDIENLVSDNHADVEGAVSFNAVNTSDELDENDIQFILGDEMDGSLELVTTLYPNNENEPINEIYLVDKETNESTKLNIPNGVMQAIVALED